MSKRTSKSKQKHTTARQDAAFMLRAIEQARMTRKPGDRVKTYRGDGTATITRIENDIVHLDNGESMHVSKVRS